VSRDFSVNFTTSRLKGIMIQEVKYEAIGYTEVLISP